MQGFLTIFLSVVGFLGDAPLPPPGSYLYQPAYELDDVLRLPAAPYAGQPGDIFLATDNALWARAGHRMAWSGPPHHSGIVFARPDGRMAILEAGPHNSIVI